jgi:hypothetical protein
MDLSHIFVNARTLKKRSTSGCVTRVSGPPSADYEKSEMAANIELVT